MKNLTFVFYFLLLSTQIDAQGNFEINTDLRNSNSVWHKNIFPKNQKLYTAQMHIHGYSNHNGNIKPGSLQWHSKFADSTSTDIIWWTDHRAFFEQEYLYSFNFTNGVYDSLNNIITGLQGNDLSPTKWLGDKNGGLVNAMMSADTIQLSLTDNQSSSTLIYSSFVPRGTKGMLRGVQRLVRPLTSKPVFSFNLSTSDLSNPMENKVIFEVGLSYHFYNQPIQQKLIYNFVDDDLPFSYELLDSSNLIINYPIHSGINFIELDLENDAQYLKDGKDNVIQDVKITLKAKNNKSVLAKFSNIQLNSLLPQDSINYQKMTYHINKYKGEYNIQQIIGTEITIDNVETTHLNGFLPETSNQSSMYVDVPELDFTEIAVPEIHAAGGVVSFNHPFGAGFGVNEETQGYRTDTMALYMLNNQAFDCDIIEVGYLQRGGVDINHHLKLWDILTANQLYLYGNGVSDMHGGDWVQNSVNFVTYLWAKDSSATNLIETLKKGRFYFGDERIYKGKFYFKVGSAEMGDRTKSKSLQAPLKINIENIPEKAYFKLTQGLIQPGLVVNYIYNDSIIDWRSPICLDISQPNFVRLAMYIGEDPVFFSNPIVFTGIEENAPQGHCSVEFFPKIGVEDHVDYDLYPSLVQNELNITLDMPENSIYKISVIDNLGKYVRYLGQFKFRAGKNFKSFSNMHLSQGNYLLLLESEKAKKTLPFSIER